MSYRNAMLEQRYTPITGAPICGNCAHRKFDQLSADARGPRKTCGIGGFIVNVMGICDHHRPADAPSAIPEYFTPVAPVPPQEAA